VKAAEAGEGATKGTCDVRVCGVQMHGNAERRSLARSVKVDQNARVARVRLLTSFRKLAWGYYRRRFYLGMSGRNVRYVFVM
jgi:hypothetical protein